MEIDWLKNFLLLAEMGHFSRAAKHSFISQPAFSRRIQQIEDWVGVILLDRSHNPVKLTPAGKEFVLVAQKILQDLEKGKEYIVENYGIPNNLTVTFAVQHSISWSFFPGWLEKLEETFVGINTHLRTDDLMSCINDLEKKQADFVICYESEMDRQGSPSNQLLSLVIGVDRLVPVSKPFKDGSPQFDLENSHSSPLPLLSFGEYAPLGRILENFIAKQKASNIVQTVYANSMGSTLRFKVNQGEGLSWLPESLVEGDLRAGNLVFAGTRKWQIELSVVLLRYDSPLENNIETIWKRIGEVNGMTTTGSMRETASDV